ncbi:MAG: disulfide bond formation protein DsbD [Bacteroidetes bacterium GWA2_30_7]|nr:MAG: disulfide bond formation protein DsbD [Bacteroidetes bacterium GWA2_30_7]
MKKAVLVSFLILGAFDIFSQVLNPVKWTYSVNKISDSEAELIFKAIIEDKWHLYSAYVGEGGPLPTVFNYEKSNKFELTGKVAESPKPEKVYDEMFAMDVLFFSHKATFTQKIKLLTDKSFKIKGTIEYMSCDDSKCIPLESDFEFKIESQKKNDDSLNTNNFYTQTDTSLSVIDSLPADSNIKTSTNINTLKESATDDSIFYTTKIDENASLWWFFVLAFVAGLAAILTPCVFPMIPMTVTFFMHSNKSKAKARLTASFYGLSIIAIYTVIGTIVAITFGANFANWLSTHWIPNVFFFLIFLFFAASFLGMFEITLPSWMVNKADKQADKGGFSGAFFMAFTLVLVSFSCTGPIVGAILVESAGGQILKPIIGMFGFSLAFALPFTLFALFPSWLSGLPKSGGWLNSVKVVLGFIELALGLKFLSIADQTYHWGILDREIYLAFWIIIFALMGFYLLGKLKFSHDSDLKHIGVPRLMLAIITFTFVIYLIPGMFGAPLKALSGYLPPQSSHDFDLNQIIRDNVKLYSGQGNTEPTSTCEKAKYSDFLHLPHGLDGYFDYNQALECSKKQNKPLFIDFTGHGCVNCREMEANVWSDPRVLKKLREDFIVVALYVDDKTDLPENEWITSTYDGKIKKTVGKKYADLQISRFNVNAQPYYVLLDTNGEILTEPRAYNLDVEAFINFLDKGIESYKNRKQ